MEERAKKARGFRWALSWGLFGCLWLNASPAWAHGFSDKDLMILFTMVFALPVWLGSGVLLLVTWLFDKKWKFSRTAKSTWGLLAAILTAIGSLGYISFLLFLIPNTKPGPMMAAIAEIIFTAALGWLGISKAWKLFRKNRAGGGEEKTGEET